VPGPPQQERSPDLGSLQAIRRQILAAAAAAPSAAASRRGLRDVRVFGSVARGDAVETSDVDLLVAPGPDTTLFDLSGFCA
jgi:predicted nucleotidyltransferase